METVEAEGSSIDEAIENALRVLEVERAKVEIEILSSATRGIFGIGGKKARVRATVRKPIDAQSLEAPVRPTQPPSPAATAAEVAPPARVAAAAPTVPRPATTTPPVAEPPRRERARPEPPPRPPMPPLAAEAIAEAQRLLIGLIEHIGCAVTVDAVQDAEHLTLTINSPDSNLLIGRHGQTLDAIEYVINRMVGRGDETSTRLSVDCEQYRVKRQRSLEQLAQRLSERAKKRGKPVSLDAMSPRDRRIVHLALESDPAVTTRSSGSGYFRKLLIIPEGARRGGR